VSLDAPLQSLTIDDFIISFFNAGTLVTFPIYIWGAAQRGIPVQVNALATIVFLVALGVVLGGQLVSHRRRKALNKPAPITVDLMSRS
jgi:spermidine/putrescine transport system permease protein